jgi:hypoxanthine-DNA glycosylase
MLTGFPPIIDGGARVLVLGSMPSAVSLKKGQYYGHPRNLFWRITGELLGFDADAAYEVRTAALREAGIAVWDVLAACERSGSLDASIARDSMVTNDFHALFTEYPGIASVFFNGAKASQIYRARVGTVRGDLAYRRLPSTSPANASIPYGVKLQAWKAILGCGAPGGCVGAGASGGAEAYVMETATRTFSP